MRKSIESESISDIVCFGYMHKWCKESEVRELEARLGEAVELLKDARHHFPYGGITDARVRDFILDQEKEKSDGRNVYL